MSDDVGSRRGRSPYRTGRSRRPDETKREPREPKAPEPRSGRVTAITAQVRDPKRVSVFLDGEFAFGMSAERIFEHRVEVGEEMTAARMAELLAVDAADRATEAAVNLLSYRARSERELRDRLRRKNFDEATIGEAIERLTRWGYLNDAEFARRWVENRATHRPRGRRLLAQELRQKGIDRDLVAETLEEAELDEDEAAREAARSRLNSLRGLDRQVAQRRLSGFLARRGFSGETIRRVVSDALGELDETVGDDGFTDDALDEG